MANVSFTKLKLNKNTDLNTFDWNNEVIEVKQYLPVMDKLQLIQNVINASADNNNFPNPVKTEIYITLEMIRFYTNIKFTDKQMEDPAKLYDLIVSSGFKNEVFKHIPNDEIVTVTDGTYECGEAVYGYRNSALGIVDTLARDYSDTEMNAENIRKQLADPESLGLLKDILSKMG